MGKYDILIGVGLGVATLYAINQASSNVSDFFGGLFKKQNEKIEEFITPIGTISPHMTEEESRARMTEDELTSYLETLNAQRWEQFEKEIERRFPDRERTTGEVISVEDYGKDKDFEKRYCDENPTDSSCLNVSDEQKDSSTSGSSSTGSTKVGGTGDIYSGSEYRQVGTSDSGKPLYYSFETGQTTEGI